MIDKLMSKINQWFNEPVGKTGSVPDEPDNELENPKRSYEGSKKDFVEKKSQPDLKLVPRRIEEFHPRGSAGRRESHGPNGSHKASMPNHGNRSKNPK
jgi:hypothetical protein